MREVQLEYNSERERLIIPEYGRNIQKLISHAKTIEDAELRQAFVERVIHLMMQMHPQNRSIDDYRERLWKHVFRIADYDIEVTVPDGISVSPEDYFKRPESIEYPAAAAKYRHYGHNVQQLIKKAISMEPGPVKNGFIAVIGSYMKLAYRTWNKDLYVSDEVILGDLKKLSNGELVLEGNISLDNLSQGNSRRKRSHSNNGDRDRHSGKSRMKGRRKKKE